MATYYVVEMRRNQNDTWSDELGEPPDFNNCFDTDDDAWRCIGQLKAAGDTDEVAWTSSDYRVAVYRGPDDHERVEGYSL